MAHGRRWLTGAAIAMALAVAPILIAAGGQPALAEDGIIYVDGEAPGPTHDGSSWETAFTGLQPALDAATAEDQIWVAVGVYTPTWKLDPEDDRSATFQMVNGVAIYGGFAGTETERGQRDWEANPTILSGDLHGDDLPAFTNREDNSYHVFYHPSELALDSTAVLDGFTITGGNADSAGPHNAGGGMYNGSSSPTLANLYVADNSAADEGGGMLNDGSSPTLTGCNFSGNTADAGGGIHNSSSSPTVTGVTFAGNKANSGGGMHNNGSSPVLVNCTFWGNSAQGKGGGMRNKTGSAPTLTNCTFYGNRATDGGAIQNFESSSPTLTNCILWGGSYPEMDNSDSSAPIVTFSDIKGDYLYPGTGNINEDPLFLDPDNGNFHLLPDSPCIDTGTGTAPFLPAADFEGDPRSMDGDRDGTATVDMGVDEALWHPVYLPLVLRGY